MIFYMTWTREFLTKHHTLEYFYAGYFLFGFIPIYIKKTLIKKNIR